MSSPTHTQQLEATKFITNPEADSNRLEKVVRSPATAPELLRVPGRAWRLQPAGVLYSTPHLCSHLVLAAAKPRPAATESAKRSGRKKRRDAGLIRGGSWGEMCTTSSIFENLKKINNTKLFVMS